MTLCRTLFAIYENMYPVLMLQYGADPYCCIPNQVLLFYTFKLSCDHFLLVFHKIENLKILF